MIKKHSIFTETTLSIIVSNILTLIGLDNGRLVGGTVAFEASMFTAVLVRWFIKVGSLCLPVIVTRNVQGCFTKKWALDVSTVL